MPLRNRVLITAFLLTLMSLVSGCTQDSNRQTAIEQNLPQAPVEVSAGDPTPEAHNPWLPDELHGVTLKDFDPEQVKAVQSWFPLEVLGWPGWEALDVNLYPVRRRVVRICDGGAVIEIIGLYVRGTGPPLTQEEKKTIIRIADEVVHATGGQKLEWSEEEYNIQQVWLHRFYKPIEVKPDWSSEAIRLRLWPHNLEQFREIVRKVNDSLGQGRITRIYLDLHSGVWVSMADLCDLKWS